MAEEIELTNVIESIRKRPGMYVGALDADGVRHMVYWALDDLLDNTRAGRGSFVKLAVFPDNSVKILDDGPALPAEDPRGGTVEERLERLMTELPVGVSRGTAPPGQIRSYLPVLRALSEKLIVDARVDGQVYSCRYECGQPLEPWQHIEQMPEHKAVQFRVMFWPDRTIFSSIELDAEYLRRRLRHMTATFPGLQTDFYHHAEMDGDEYEPIRMPNGMADIVTEVMNHAEVNIPHPQKPVRLRVHEGELAFDVAIQWHWGDKIKRNLILSWANSVKTSEGSHILGVKEAMWETGLDKLLFVAAVSVFVPQPRFTNPVKDCLRNPEIRQMVRDHLTAALRRLKNSDEFTLRMDYIEGRLAEDG